MSKKTENDLNIEAYALGCLNKEETDRLHEFLFSNEEHPWRELGEYQNLTSLLPSFLDIDPPPKSVINNFRKSLSQLKADLHKNRAGITFPPIVEEEEKGLRPQTVLKNTGTLKEQEDLRSKSGKEQEKREHNIRGSEKTQIKGRDKERSVREKYGFDEGQRKFGSEKEEVSGSEKQHSVREGKGKISNSDENLVTREKDKTFTKEDIQTDSDVLKNNAVKERNEKKVKFRHTAEIHNVSETGGGSDRKVTKEFVSKTPGEPEKSSIPEHKAKHVHNEKKIDKDADSPKVTRADYGSRKAVQFRTTKEEIADERYADKKKWHVNKTPHGSMVTLQRNQKPEDRVKRVTKTVNSPAVGLDEDRINRKFTALWVVVFVLLAALAATYILLNERISELETILESRGLLP